jgi:lipid A 3-O-deacylase
MKLYIKALGSIALLLFSIPFNLMGQKIDNMASFRDIKDTKYIRLNYENDFFTSSDQDYTQGYNLELVAPWLKKNPVQHLFISPKKSEFRYGLSLEQIGFTPNDISSYDIQYGERPYAAVIMVKSFLIATDTIHKSRLASSFSLGLIGPGAFGGDIQREIHRILDNTIPNGWSNQIQNDVVANYEISYEKQVLRLDNFFSLQTHATARLGTLFTNASLGLSITLGIINSPFSSAANKNKFQLYVYTQPIVNAIGYDATLQGGLLNRKSLYTIPGSDIERFTAQNNYGIVFQYHAFYLEYTQTMLTREISTANPHKWGGIRIGYKL